MIFLSGAGSLRTSVGTARIWSPEARAWVLQQINDLDVIPARQVLIANAPQIAQGGDGSSCLARGVQPKLPNVGGGLPVPPVLGPTVRFHGVYFSLL